MTKRGQHTPISDEEAEDFARRMAEHGATEDEISSPYDWQDYCVHVLEWERGYEPTAAQADLIARSRALYSTGLQESGLRLITGMIRGRPFYRYADVVTGRILSAADAYSRRYTVGISVPRVWRYIW